MDVHAGAQEKAPDPVPESYGLRRGTLSPIEVLAQSISTIAPSTTPALTVPLVFALAGNGSWLAYVIAMGAMVLVSLPIAAFARTSASPGSLYVYTRDTLPRGYASVAMLALFFAYVMTAASVIGGFVNSCQLFLGTVRVPAVVLAMVAGVGAFLFASGEVRFSARVMLWVELTSVSLIAVVVVLVLVRHGFKVDMAQVRLQGASASGVRLGVMLAVFSFVGFESATTLGVEAQRPLRTIPRAVVLSAVTVGVFFVGCTYAEVVGFRGSGMSLGESTAPFRMLAAAARVAWIGPVIDAGVLVSMFAATLACVIAAGRVLLLMTHDGMVSKKLGRTHARTKSPVAACAVTAGLALAPAAVLVLRGVSGADVYGYMGTLAVYGFLTVYALVVVAAVVFVRRRGDMTAGRWVIALVAGVAMVAGLVGSVVPVPPAPYRYLPWVYAGYLVCGCGWAWRRRVAS